MRLFSPTTSPNDRQRQEEFAGRILAIGEGRVPITTLFSGQWKGSFRTIRLNH